MYLFLGVGLFDLWVFLSLGLYVDYRFNRLSSLFKFHVVYILFFFLYGTIFNLNYFPLIFGWFFYWNSMFEYVSRFIILFRFFLFLFLKSLVSLSNVIFNHLLCSLNKLLMRFFFICSILEEISFFLITFQLLWAFLLFLNLYILWDIFICRVILLALSNVVIFPYVYFFR